MVLNQFIARPILDFNFNALFIDTDKTHYRAQNALKSHYERHRECKLECTKCGNKFKRESEREIHNQEHHNKQN